jgi:drug/metabolite transporter (DMT)-like permease
VLLAYGGVVVLVAGGAVAREASLLGDAIVFVSAFLLAERTIYLAQAVQRLDPVKLLLSQAAIGCAIFVAASSLMEPAPTRWTLRLVGAIAYQGVLIAGFCFVNLWLLRRYRPSGLAAFFLTQPIFGVVAAALLTGDRLTPALVIACVAVAAGIGLSSRRRV